MRTIKFRGKTTDTNEWVYGDLVHNYFDGTSKTIEIGIKKQGFYPREVLAGTVSQFTGLYDKEENEIYGGDEISVHQFLFEGYEIEKEWKGIVRWVEEHNSAGWGIKVISGEFALEHTGYSSYEEMPPFTFSTIYGLHEESFEITGNIHEKQDGTR